MATPTKHQSPEKELDGKNEDVSNLEKSFPDEIEQSPEQK